MTTSERVGTRGSSQAAESGRDTSAVASGAGVEERRQRAPWVAALLAALLLGLVLGGGSAYLAYGQDGGTADPFGGHVRASTYQAVMLSNDKVYFGQLRQVSDDFYQLRRAFFLREARKDEKSEPLRAVVPLIREVHAPENSMLIRVDEIVVVENLDENSPVLAEILRQQRDQQ